MKKKILSFSRLENLYFAKIFALQETSDETFQLHSERASIFPSPVFPGITGPSPPWSGGLGLWASGMALSSGASGTTGFALGTAEGRRENKYITVRQSVSHWRDRMPGITTTC